MKNKKIVGIDLGTTNSVISIVEGATPIIIINAEGTRTTPSVVSFNKEGEILVGNIAKRQITLNAENTFYSVKRLIGCKYDEIQNEIYRLPYKIIKDKNGNVKLYSSNLKKEFSPEEISSLILKKLISDANRYLKDEIKQAVITVPAYFNDSQRVSTKDAAQIAGLEVKKIINEPTAAALAYGFAKKLTETVLIFDLGGGTFDVSLLEIGKDFIEVLATTGDTHLGGDDFDQIIVKYLINDFEKKEGINLYNEKATLQRIIEAAEKAKIELSSLESTTIDIPYVGLKNQIPLHLKAVFTRSKFEELILPLVKKCEEPVLQAIKDANLNLTNIDKVILVGGSTRIPLVKNLLIKLLNKPLNENVNPDEVVAMGAAIEASILAGEITNVTLLDVIPLSLGVEVENEIMMPLIKRNTRIPVNVTEKFSTAADNQTSVCINILQGERLKVSDNKSLGQFILDGIPKAKRGIPEIQVTFKINSDGLLNVSALETKTGITQSIKIEGSSSLNSSEIDQIIKESEKYEQSDKLNKKLFQISSFFDELIKKNIFILTNLQKKNTFFTEINYIFSLIQKLQFYYNNSNFSKFILSLNNFIIIYNLIFKKLL